MGRSVATIPGWAGAGMGMRRLLRLKAGDTTDRKTTIRPATIEVE